MSKPFLEALKEAARVGIFAVLGVIGQVGATGHFDWKVSAVAVVIAVGKATDRYIHVDPSNTAKGLLPF